MITDVFCKIIKGELKSDAIYKDKDYVVIRDINPQAPVHILIIPVKHFSGLEDFKKEDEVLLGRGFILAHEIAKKLNLGKGYRVIINEGEHGGKLVPHFHIHLLGGRRLGTKMVK